MNEDDIRRAMGARTSPTNPDRERLHKARTEATRRRYRRNNVKVAVASSALSVLAVVGVTNLQSDAGGGREQATVDFVAQIESTEQAKPSATTARRPETIVGASSAGRLVLIDSQTGQTTKVLTVLQHPNEAGKGGLLGRVTVSNDAEVVYFDAATGDTCRPAIRRIAATGGPVEPVTTGSAPALSPNGESLAFVRTPTCGAPHVMVRNLADGTERVVGAGPTSGEVAVAIPSLSWSPDGMSILADVRYGASRLNHHALLAADRSTPLEQATRVAPPASAQAGTVWQYGAYLPDGRIFVSERCCSGSGSRVTNQVSRMVLVDPTGPPNSQVIAFGFVEKTHTAMTSDETGDHLLYLSGDTLMVSDGGARPTPLAYGLVGATWVPAESRR